MSGWARCPLTAMKLLGGGAAFRKTRLSSCLGLFQASTGPFLHQKLPDLRPGSSHHLSGNLQLHPQRIGPEGTTAASLKRALEGGLGKLFPPPTPKGVHLSDNSSYLSAPSPGSLISLYSCNSDLREHLLGQEGACGCSPAGERKAGWKGG